MFKEYANASFFLKHFVKLICDFKNLKERVNLSLIMKKCIYYLTIVLLFHINTTSCQTNSVTERAMVITQDTVSKIPYGAIPITISEKGHILMEIKVNNVPAKVLLETAMQGMLFDSTFVFSNIDSLKFSLVKDNYALPTVHGAIPLNYRIKSKFTVTCGNEKKEEWGAIHVCDLKKHLGAKLDMMTPVFHFLKDNILLLDIKNGYVNVNILQDSLSMHTQEYFMYKLVGKQAEYFNIIDTLSFYIDGEVLKTGGNLIIDLGNPFSISLVENYLPKTFIDGIKNLNITDIESVDNERRTKKTFYTDSISFTNLKVTSYNEEIFIYKLSRAREQLGTLGIDFLKDYIVIFDFKDKKMYLKPHERQ